MEDPPHLLTDSVALADLAKATKAARNKRKKAHAKVNKKNRQESTSVSASAKIKEEEEEEEVFKHFQDLAIKEKAALQAAESVNASTEPFKIKRSEGKGRGVFALRNFEQNQVIFVETCLLPDANSTSWFVNEVSYVALESEERKKRLGALTGRCSCGCKPCIETDVEKKWVVNSFEIHLPEMEDRILVFEHASRLNHACLPNARYGFTKDRLIVVRALKNIAKGEEIFINYMGMEGTTRERRDAMFQRYAFRCQCITCKTGEKITEEDMMVSAGGINPRDYIRFEKELPKSEVIGMHTTDGEKEVIRHVHAWVQTLIHEIPSFYMEMRDIVDTLQKEYLTDRGQPDRGQLNLDMGKLVLEAWKRVLKQEDKFGLTDQFLALHTARQTAEFNELLQQQPGMKMKEALFCLAIMMEKCMEA